MHYLLLGIGILIGIYGLYRFFLQAEVKQIVTLLIVTVFTVLCAALFFLAVTGRLPAALGLLAALWPFAAALWHRKHRKAQPQSASSSAGPMTRKDALEVLGLKEGASDEQIQEAYKTLIKKNHPDQQGSEWLAARINQARDLLLKKQAPAGEP